MKKNILLFIIIFEALCSCNVVVYSKKIKAYISGRNEAKKEIENGYVTWYTYGLPVPSHTYIHYNLQNGIPYKNISGCMVSDTIIAKAKGHNDYIKKYLGKGNVPKNCLKNFNQIIKNPDKFLNKFIKRNLMFGSFIKTRNFQVVLLKNVYNEFLIKFINMKRNTRFDYCVMLNLKKSSEFTIYTMKGTDLFLIISYKGGTHIFFDVFDGIGGILLNKKLVKFK